VRTALAVACIGVLALAACGGSSRHHVTATQTRAAQPTTETAATTATVTRPPAPKPPSHPQLLPAALGSGPAALAPAVRWHGQTAAWIERASSGVAVMAFDQKLVELHLHSGTIDAGTLGWRYGPLVAGAELRRLVAAFNGGFRLSTGAGGFESYGRSAVPLRNGLASVVTYADGSTDIGSWHQEVPSGGKRVVSVRQNLTLLVDHGVAASTVGCVSCWGATLGGVSDPARAALGITAGGRLIWVGGEHLTVSELADVLLAQHVVRAAELDINPEWVAGYFYGHRGGKGRPAPVPALPSQSGIPGQFLAPWARDFFTVVAH
jgi:hypothetical protein